MFDEFETGRIAVDGVEIDYVAAGSGEPVLMLHGFPQNKALWAQIAPALVARGYRVVCADLRGYGASSKPAADTDLDNYSFRAMAADQVGLMRALGHDRFHLVGHDRGARVAHRLCLDHADAVASVTLMDIVPTAVLLTDLRKDVAQSYWHWFFLAQPAPFPERVIESNPDLFYETCLFGWGAASAGAFQADQLAAYRASWHDREAIAGSCNDYRAALGVDLRNDLEDHDRRISAPTLILYGASGAMAKLYDIPAAWAPLCIEMEARAIAGGHFFPDIEPAAVVDRLVGFFQNHPLEGDEQS
ncbi:alpha/beta hydrolase [Agrobacterium tumefaciens]|nr:alpha/beta hydrolase [Agrobacterium tumefaciens]MCZ7497336.1 alpha/beta hydrolase [Rhizobium rhizogenes]NTE56550.1 alpha/beta hydrolase [Agrobacterium tumefaciens]NTE74518.1 alpha/beta hydrolase [Agrobacterium tumefaciens]